MTGISFAPEALSRLLPMHLVVTAQGQILQAGPTAAKFLAPQDRRLVQVFSVQRPVPGMPIPEALAHAVAQGERLLLRSCREPALTLRAQVVAAEDGRLVMNLGFGVGLAEAVARLNLTANDFSPCDLAMEMLFFIEANRGVLHELSLFQQRLEAARDLAQLEAHTDPLTGLQNCRGFETALQAALARTRGMAEGRAEAGFALLHLDLDRFKQVNDRLGHAAGDQLLRHVARVLRSEVRNDDCAARLGGDEFVLLLRGLVDRAALMQLGRRIISAIEQPVTIEGEACDISASIGIVTSRCYGQPQARQMMADADSALYHSKNNGRGQVTLHELV